MAQVYIAVETMSAIIIFILLYANRFELRNHTPKSDVFTWLLIANEIVVVVDTISWLKIDWNNHIILFKILLTLTYIVPFYIVGIFSKYIYEHISERTDTGKGSFLVIIIATIVFGFLFFVLCLMGKLFEIRNGKYYAGPLSHFYYLFYVVILLFLSGVIFAHSKKLGIHDLIAAQSFCFFPLLSIIISMTNIGINLAIPAMAVNMLIIYIVLQSDSENKLFYQSNNDEMTGVLNRRAYDEEIYACERVPEENDLNFISIDVNGLKIINDSKGHDAGDELIIGTCECMKKSFGDYGKIYRIGGDEFIAILFCSYDKTAELIDEFEELLKNWKGKRIENISVSYGWSSKKENPELSLRELEKIADQRMYEAKSAHYRKSGFDRRGQSSAHKALCSLYTKILKINLTDDSYVIVNMNSEEKTDDKGFSEKISEWLRNFGSSGQVHTEDLQEYFEKTEINYLREYFRQNNAILSLSYRRKAGKEYKPVIMEMIPADDYDDDNQNLFLYVKAMN